MSLLVTGKYHIQILAKYLCCRLKNQFVVFLYMLYFIVQDDDRACKFFKWLDTSICCTRGAATTPIVIAKFKRLKHAVEACGGSC